MALSTIDFNTTFDYTALPKVLGFEDTVDYSGQSVNISNATGVIKVVNPAGDTVYNNTNHSAPDINPSVSRLNTTTIPIPLMGNGSVMQGKYSFTYTVRYTDDTLAQSYDVAYTKTFTLNYTSPSIDIEMEVDCILPLLSATDDTSYTVNYVTPTITRDFEIQYPGSVGIAPVTGTAQELTTSVVYVVSGTPLQYSSSLTSTLSYNFGDGFYVSDEITGNAYIDVLCDSNLCDVYCALRAQYRRWQNVKGTITREHEELSKFNVMMSIAQLIASAIKCGKTDDISGYVTQLKQIGNFDDCNCGDSNGEPTLVTGLGSSSTVVVEAGSGITVATATGGGVTTYTISLTSAYLNKLNNAYNTVVASGTGVSVAVATASDGTKTYTVTNTQTQPDILASLNILTFASGNLPVIGNESYKTYGTALQNTTIVADYDASASNWQVNPAVFDVSGFFTGGSLDYYPEIEVVNTVHLTIPSAIFNRPYVAEIISMGATSFKFRINDRATGQAVTGSAVDAQYTQMRILIKIIA